MLLASFKSEYLKLKYSKLNKMVLTFVLLCVTLFTYMSAKSVLNVGLNATVKTNPELFMDIPPIEYLGLENMYPVMMGLIITAGVFGANEFSNNSIRTTLLSNNNKKKYFLVKTTIIALIAFVVSFVSAYLCNSITHMALGDLGLNPFTLSKTVWKFIMYSVFSCTTVSLIAYFLAFISRSAIVSLLFLLVQISDIRRFLPNTFPIARFLPGYLAEELIADSPELFAKEPLMIVLALMIWLIVLAVAAYVSFSNKNYSEMKGES